MARASASRSFCLASRLGSSSGSADLALAFGRRGPLAVGALLVEAVVAVIGSVQLLPFLLVAHFQIVLF